MAAPAGGRASGAMVKTPDPGLRNGHGRVFRYLAAAGLLLYLLLLSFNSLTRTRQFSPDSMNYVDVARNMAGGRGLVQTTLGFNQPLLFDRNSRRPAPFTSQAPLYPLLIVGLNRCGLSCADAALVIPIIASGLVLILAWLLMRGLYGPPAGLLSLACLLVNFPLRHVSRHAWAEPVGLVFVLLALLFLVRARRETTTRSATISALVAGLAAGLAFATRYALLPLSLAGLLLLLPARRPAGSRLPALLLFAIGAALPIGGVLTRNALLTGRILPPVLPSDQSLPANLGHALIAIFGNYLGKSEPGLQVALVVAVVAFAVVRLVRRRGTDELVSLFLKDGRHLPVVWILVYSGFVILQRTGWHFDPIDARIMIPAQLIAIPLVVALVVMAVEPRRGSLVPSAILGLAILAVGVREVGVTLNRPPLRGDEAVARSDRLTWVARHTTDSDLLIGEDAVDIPFYLGRPAVASFSRYPYTVHLTYQALLEHVDGAGGRYRRVYLILRRGDRPGDDEQAYWYGRFITDIRRGNLAPYPRIVEETALPDADVFRVSGGPEPDSVPRGARARNVR